MNRAVETANHELRHALSAAVAACQQEMDATAYNKALLHVSARAESGEVAIDSGNHEVDKSVMRLAAFGPVAADEDAVELALGGDTDRLQKAGQLSQQDLHIGDGCNPGAMATNLAAVQHLERRLKTVGFTQLAKLLRDVDRQNVDPLLLADFVPRSAAMAALRVGKQAVSKMLAPDRETPEQNIARLQAAHDAKQAAKQAQTDAAWEAERASYQKGTI